MSLSEKKKKCMRMLMMPDEELIEFIKKINPEMYRIFKDDTVNPLPDVAICHYLKKIAQDVIDDKATRFDVIDKNGKQKILFEYLGD